MRTGSQKMETFFLVVIILIVVALPFGISFYDKLLLEAKIPPGARLFTLTGHAERGWLIGDVPAYRAVTFWQQQGQPIENRSSKCLKATGSFSS